MTEPVVRLTGVSKQYVKYEDAPMLATAMLRLRSRTRRSKLWAVRGVDLEVASGECLGVIGRNGSGKSTLLQMLSGITAPTEGRITVRGRVAPLISVGVGFHPELSGRDNVYVNGTILGLTRAEIDRRFDAIVAFAELPEFIDTPVKFYSSGMAVRLGFAVAVQADPEVLVVDEVLAVGDFAFQLKCFERIQEIRDGGATVLVVTHNLNAVRQMSDRAVLLHAGRKEFEGDTAEAISRYHEVMREGREIEGRVEDEGRIPIDDHAAEVLDVELLDEVGTRTHHVNHGEQICARARIKALRDLEMPFAGVLLTSATGVTVYNDSNRAAPYPPLRAGEVATYDVRLAANLVGGSYTVTMVLGYLDGSKPTRVAENTVLDFYVAGRPNVHGLADLSAGFVQGS